MTPVSIETEPSFFTSYFSSLARYDRELLEFDRFFEMIRKVGGVRPITEKTTLFHKGKPVIEIDTGVIIPVARIDQELLPPSLFALTPSDSRTAEALRDVYYKAFGLTILWDPRTNIMEIGANPSMRIIVRAVPLGEKRGSIASTREIIAGVIALDPKLDADIFKKAVDAGICCARDDDITAVAFRGSRLKELGISFQFYPFGSNLPIIDDIFYPMDPQEFFGLVDKREKLAKLHPVTVMNHHTKFANGR